MLFWIQRMFRIKRQSSSVVYLAFNSAKSRAAWWSPNVKRTRRGHRHQWTVLVRNFISFVGGEALCYDMLRSAARREQSYVMNTSYHTCSHSTAATKWRRIIVLNSKLNFWCLFVRFWSEISRMECNVMWTLARAVAPKLWTWLPFYMDERSTKLTENCFATVAFNQVSTAPQSVFSMPISTQRKSHIRRQFFSLVQLASSLSTINISWKPNARRTRPGYRHQWTVLVSLPVSSLFV